MKFCNEDDFIIHCASIATGMLLASSGQKLWCNLPNGSSLQRWETTNRVEKEMIRLCIYLFNISLDKCCCFFLRYQHKRLISCIIPHSAWNSEGSAWLVDSPVISVKKSCPIATELVMQCLCYWQPLSLNKAAHIRADLPLPVFCTTASVFISFICLPLLQMNISILHLNRIH